MCLKDRTLSVLQMGNTMLRATFSLQQTLDIHEPELKEELNKILGLEHTRRNFLHSGCDLLPKHRQKIFPLSWKVTIPVNKENTWGLKFGSEKKSLLKKWKFGESQCMVTDLWPAENYHYTFAQYLYSSQWSQPRQDALKRFNPKVTKPMNLLENNLLKWKDHSPRYCNELNSTAALLFCQPWLQHSVWAWYKPQLHLHISWYWNLII